MDKAQYEYWMELADYDLETAKAMLDSKRYLYVGYMCHLTIEKASKALIAAKSETPPKSHNLTKLAELGGIADKLSAAQFELIDKLQPLNIEARYPSVKDQLFKELDSKTCKDLLLKTKELLLWMQNELKLS